MTGAPETNPPPREDWYWPVLAAAVIVLALALSYANSFAGRLVFDDIKQIVGNEKVSHLDPAVQLKTRRPVTSLTLALNAEFTRFNQQGYPTELGGYHLVNLLIHMAAALTLFGLVRQVLRLPLWDRELRRSATHWALAVALLWAVHPLQTQSVTYVIQRAESLMGLFYLLVLYTLVRASQARPPRHHLWLVACVVAGLLSAGSKAVAITIPLVAVLFDRTFLASSFGEVLRRRGVAHGALLLAVITTITLAGVTRGILAHGPGVSNTVGFSVENMSWYQYAASQPEVILHYLRLSLWPTGQCLDKLWALPKLADQWPQVALCGTLVLGLLTAALWAWRWRPWVGFVGTTFFLILAPTSSIVPIKDLVFEHRMYLSLASVVILLLAAGHRWFPSRDQLALRWGAVIVLSIVLSVITSVRNTVYHSDEAMWKDVIAKAPHNPRGYSHLGNTYHMSRRSEEAVRVYQEGIAMAPKDASLSSNLGAALESLGRLDEAEESYRRAMGLNPTDSVVMMNLANTLSRMKRFDEAFVLYRQALAIEEGKAKPEKRNVETTLQNLAVSLTHADRPEEALIEIHKLAQLTPDSARAQEEVARISFMVATRSEGAHQAALLAEAEAAARKAITLEFHEPAKVYWYLGNILRVQTRYQEAADCYSVAISARGGRWHDAQVNRCICLIELRQLPAALAELAVVLAEAPDHLIGNFHMARIYSLQRDLVNARKYAQHAIDVSPGFTPARNLLRELSP